MKFRLQFRVGHHFFRFQIYRWYNIDDAVVGVNSNLNKKDCHILMADYDSILSLPLLIRELKRLQKKFGLGDAHVFESSFNKYYVAFFKERMRYIDAIAVLRDTPCDPRYKEFRMVRDEMTLRLTPKADHKGRQPCLIAVVKGVSKPLNAENEAILKVFMDYTDGWHEHKIVKNKSVETLKEAVYGS